MIKNKKKQQPKPTLKTKMKKLYLKSFVANNQKVSFSEPYPLETAINNLLGYNYEPSEFVFYTKEEIQKYEEDKKEGKLDPMSLKLYERCMDENFYNRLKSLNLKKTYYDLSWKGKPVFYKKDYKFFLEKTDSLEVNNELIKHLNVYTHSTYHLEGCNLYKDNSLVFTFSEYSPICNITFLEQSNWKTILDAYNAQREQDDFLAFFDKKVA